MVNKIYVSANDYLRDGWRLARRVLDSEWRPDVLIALWRGGAPVGVAVHEFLHYHGLRPRHHVLKCQSYTGIQARADRVEIESAAQILESVKPGARVLVIDDILDTGNTARAMFDLLAPRGAEVRLATVYWKPGQTKTGIRPDYHVCETEDWIVFPHEMDGLTPDELRLKDPVLYGLLAPAASR
jgi:hypoxanthine phosphoribosyltransferase